MKAKLILYLSPDDTAETIRLAETLSIACGHIRCISTISLEIAKICNQQPVFDVSDLEKMFASFPRKKNKQKRKGWESPYKFHK